MKNQEIIHIPVIIGNNDDVIPAVNRAILSGHDMLIIGQDWTSKD